MQSDRKNPLLLAGAIYGLVVAILISAIIVVAVNRPNKTSGPERPEKNEPIITIEPTPELAESVCKKYGGELEVFEGEEVMDDYGEVESKYICEKFENAQQVGDMQMVVSYAADDFMYEVDFIKEDKIEERWARLKSANKVSDNRILENSDDAIRMFDLTQVNGATVETDMIMYKKTAAVILTYSEDSTLAKEILNELGFSYGEESDDKKLDSLRKNDYSMLVVAVNSYISSNRGKIAGLVEKGDPFTLDASKWINTTGEDPNGNPYILRAYTYDTWNNLENKKPAGDNGSEVSIIISANCSGEDADGNPMPQADVAVRAFAVYGYLEEGSFCQASGSSN